MKTFTLVPFAKSSTKSFVSSLSAIGLLLLFLMSSVSYGQTVVALGGEATVTCPATSTATWTTPPTGVSFSNFTRGSGVTCVSSSTALSGSGFNTASAAASITANTFYTVTITADATHNFTLSSIVWAAKISGTSNSCSFLVKYNNNGAGLVDFAASQAISSSGTLTNLTFTGNVVVAAGTSVIVDLIPYSATASGTTIGVTNASTFTVTASSASTVSGAPTIGTATVAGVSGTASVPFTAPASNGGSTITTYTATSSPGGITGTLSQAGSGTITVSGLTNGTAYTFKVTATNGVGVSAASAASNSVTPYTTPGAPTIGTALASGVSGTVGVPFTAPVSNGGSVITTYTATSSPGGITGTLTQAGSGTITVSGLTNGTAYTFTVTATNAAGVGAASAASNSVTPFISPSINGTIVAGEYGTHTDGNNQQSSTTGTWYMTSDATNLYIAISGANTTQAAVLYLDKSPIVPVNGGTNSDGTLVGYSYDGSSFANLQFRADLAVYFKDGYQEYRTADGANGWSTATTSGMTYASAGGSVREIAIPWSSIGGRPAAYNWFGYVAYSGGGAYASVPTENPGSGGGTTIGSSAAWDRYYTVSTTSTMPFSRKSYTFTSSSDVTSFGSISVYDFTMNSAGRFISRTGNVSGNWTIGGNLTLGAGTIYLGSGGTGYGTTSIAGNLNILGGTFNMDQTTGAVAVTGNVAVASGGTLTLSGQAFGDFSLAGNWSNLGTFTPNSRLVTFNGSSAQTLTGATTFDYLTLNNSAGLTLANNVSVNLTLGLTLGKITLGNNSMTVGSAGTISGASSSNYIVESGTGVLTKNAVGNTAVLFPVGLNGTNYTPISLTNTSGTSNLSVLVGSTITNAVADATKIVNLQWAVTSSAATTATVTPVWVASNQAASFTNTGTGELGNYATSYTTYSTTLATTTTTTAGVALQSGSNLIVVGNTNAVVCTIPNNVTVAAASVLPASSSVSWTAPTGCYTEVMIVAAPATNTGTPSGNGSTYTASLTYASGTALGNGFVVYKGTTSPQVITGLTNGTTYYYKIFTRNGSNWSSGFEVSATPSVTYCASTGTVAASSTYFTSFSTTGGTTNISNTSSGYTANGYGNFTASQTVTQVQNSTVNFSTVIFGVSGQVGVGIWVDWNQNGVFTDAGESMYNTSGTFVSSSPSGSFTVPSGAMLGSTRMRIVVNFNSSTPVSCNSVITGETEDYTFTVIAACTQPTTQATIAAYTANTTGTTLTANWTRGNGTGGVIVVARATATAAVNPTSGTTYTPTTTGAFGGTTTTGTGNIVIYNGTGTSVNVTGLTSGVGYTFSVYEYNSATTCYTTPASSSAVTACTSGTPAVSIAVTTGANPTCAGTSITFTATPTNGGTPTYQWKLNGTNVGSSSATYTNAALANGDQVSCVMTNAVACSTTATSNTITMSVSAVPTTSVAGTNQTICSGATVTLAANTVTVGTGAWTVTGPSALTTQFNNTASPTAVFTPAGGVGTYTLTWTISNGACVASASSITVTVNTAATATASNGGPYCPGATIQLTGGPAGYGSYSWTGPNGFSSPAVTQTVSQNFDGLPTATSSWVDNSSLPGWYINAVNYLGSDSGSSGTGGIRNYGITADTNRTLGSLNTATTVASGSAGLRYAVKITNTTGLTVSNVNITYKGMQFRDQSATVDKLTVDYQLNATSISTGTWTAIPALDFNSPNASTLPSTTSLSTNLVLGTTLANGESIWIRWNDLDVANSDDGLGIDDVSVVLSASNPSPTITNATTAMSGVYTLTTTNTSGCTATATTTVVVNPQPQGSLTANGPFCTTGAGQLTWTATAGTGPYTVVYNDGIADRTVSSVVSGTPFNVFTTPVTATTTYNLVSVADVNCSRSTSFTGSSATITINPVHTISLTSGSASSSTCINTALSTNIVYTFGGGASGAGITGLPSGMSGVVSGSTFTISGTPTASGTFNYTITTTGNSCTVATATGSITVAPLLGYANLQYPPNATLCPSGTLTAYGQIYLAGVTPGAGQGAGVTVQFGYNGTNSNPSTWTNWSAATYNVAATGNNDEYLYNFTPPSSGTFYYTFRYSNGSCNWQYGGYTSGGGGFWDGSTNVSGVLTVNPNHTLALTSGSATPTLCINTTLGTNIVYTTGGGATGAGVTGLPAGMSGNFSGSTFTISGTPSVSGTFNYTVTTTGNSCTVATATGTITVNPILTASVSISASATTVCSGTNVTFTATPTNGGLTPSYQWKVNGINAGTNSTTFTSSTIVTSDSVTVVMTSNASPCLTGSPATSNAIVMTVNALPTASITENIGSTCAGSTVEFTVTGTSGAVVTYNLNGGSSATTTLTAGTATITVSGATTSQTLNLVSVTDGTCPVSLSGSSTVAIESTTWSNIAGGSWSNGTPSSTKAAIISYNYTVSSDFSACSLTITNNAVVTVDSGKNVNLNGAVTVSSGSLTLNNLSNLLQADASAVNSGNIIVKRQTKPLIRLDYTAWASPVSGQEVYAFSPLTFANRFYVYDSSSNLYSTSVASTPLLNVTGVNAAGVNGTDSNHALFTTAKGFLIRLPYNHPTAAAVWTGTFTGVPNNGTKTFSLSARTVSTDGYNLVGNPYPSALSIDQFATDNASTIEPTLYFWRKTNNTNDASYCSWNTSTHSFTYNVFANHLLTPSTTLNPNGVIEIGQGFFVQSKAGATSLVFNNGQRVAADSQDRFFRNTPATSATTTTEAHRIWLNLTGTNAEFSQTLVGYFTNSTLGLEDTDSKFLNDGVIALNTKIGADELVMQGRPVPFDASDVVPLNYKITTAGTYTFAIDHADGLFEAGAQTVYIKDTTDGTYHDITSTPYVFTTAAGTFYDRFELVYQNLLAVNQNAFSANTINVIHQQNNDVVINTATATMATVRIYDIRGRLLLEKKDINTSETKVNVGTTNQVLLVEVTTVDGFKATRKVVN